MNDLLEALACRPPRGGLLQAQPGRTADEAAAALRLAQVVVQRGAAYAPRPAAPRTLGMHVRESPAVYGAPPAAVGTGDGERELPEGLGIAHDDLFAGLSQNFGAPPP